MNAPDVLKYGHYEVMNAVKDLPDANWMETGVCGVWSVRDIIAHLASYEHLLVEILSTFVDGGPTPTVEKFFALGPQGFNDEQVAERQSQSPEATFAEYQSTQTHTDELIVKIPLASLRQTGAIPWYGEEYDLEDIIAYSFYGHKREHCAQIAVYRDCIAKVKAD